MASTPVSPKVTAGAAVAAIVGLLLQYGATITPATFAWLGAGQSLAFTVVTLGVGALAAWWKTDPLRVVPPDIPPAATESAVNITYAAPAPVPAVAIVESIPAVITVDATPPTATGAHVASPLNL